MKGERGEKGQDGTDADADTVCLNITGPAGDQGDPGPRGYPGEKGNPGLSVSHENYIDLHHIIITQ